MGRTSPNVELPDSVALEVADVKDARYVASLPSWQAGSSQLLTLRILDPSRRSALHTYTASATGGNVLSAIDAVAAKVRRDLGDSDSDISAAIPLLPGDDPVARGAALACGRTERVQARTLQ